MHIDIIDDYASLCELEEQWKTVHDADPQASFFLSWTWISKWLGDVIEPWFVLAARRAADSGDYVAFFPLRVTTEGRKGGGFYHNIQTAGRSMADATGLICLPDFEDEALPGFSNYLTTLNWENLELRYVCGSDKRFDLLLDGFPNREFKQSTPETVFGSDTTDYGVSLRVDLPDDWETYLTTKLSATGRRNVRRVLRKVEEDDRFRITHADADTFDRDLEILLKFWASRWAEEYSKNLASVQRVDRIMLKHCFDEGVLSMPVLWDGERPICAAANILDAKNGALLCKLLGRDETFHNPSPGVILVAHAIRHAISLGFTRCEFGQGNHGYKYAFGVEEYRLKHRNITRKQATKSVQCLDKRWLAWALMMADRQRDTGRTSEAIKGYRQILRVDPHNLVARQTLVEQLTRQGHHAAAKKILEAVPAAGEEGTDRPTRASRQRTRD